MWWEQFHRHYHLRFALGMLVAFGIYFLAIGRMTFIWMIVDLNIQLLQTCLEGTTTSHHLNFKRRIMCPWNAVCLAALPCFKKKYIFFLFLLMRIQYVWIHKLKTWEITESLSCQIQWWEMIPEIVRAIHRLISEVQCIISVGQELYID